MPQLDRHSEFDDIATAGASSLNDCYQKLVDDDADSRYDQLNPITLTADDMVRRMLVFIDLQKIKGFNHPEALTAFRSFIRRMIMKDFGAGMSEPEFDVEERFVEWFNQRWDDRHVYIDVPEEYLKYLNGDHALFTPPRLEPIDVIHFNKTPFNERGPKGFISRPKGSSLRVADGEDDDVPYRTFVVRQNLPRHLYMEVPESVATKALVDGFDEVDRDDKAYLLGKSVEAARSAAAGRSQQQDAFGSKTDSEDRVALSVDVEALELNQDKFYTKKLSGSKNKGGHRTFGIFYEGKIPATALSLVKAQKVKGYY